MKYFSIIVWEQKENGVVIFDNYEREVEEALTQGK